VEELKLHPITVSKTYPAGALDFHTAEFHQLGNLRVRGVAELVGEEIRFRGHLGTRVRASCDRCLGLVEIPVECDFDLTYRPMASIARNEEVKVSPDELEVGFYTGGGIELADVVAEQVNLSLPMKTVCRTECRGLCPVCGANRNLQECQCSEAVHESPFAKLLGK
jgi:uncharacterized protein